MTNYPPIHYEHWIAQDGLVTEQTYAEWLYRGYPYRHIRDEPIDLYPSISKFLGEVAPLLDQQQVEYAIGELISVIEWNRCGKQVFCLPRIFQEQLYHTNLNEPDIHDLFQLPYRAIYLNLADSMLCSGNYRADGFYLCLGQEPDVNGTKSSETLMFHFHTSSGSPAQSFTLHLPSLIQSGSVASYINKLIPVVDDALLRDRPTVNESDREDARSTLIKAVKISCSLVNYLNTNNTDVRRCHKQDNERKKLLRLINGVKNPKSKKARRYQTRLDLKPAYVANIVGEREVREITSNPNFRMAAPRHWRRGHYHRFWKGPRKYPAGHELAGEAIPFEEWSSAMHDGEPVRYLHKQRVEAVLINPDLEGSDDAREYVLPGSHAERHRAINKVLLEGRKIEVKLNRYERNPTARQECLDHHGLICAVCDYEPRFDHRLKDNVADALQVHHVVPISTVGKRYRVDPRKDLVPVCYACHRYIHSRTTPYSVKDLRKTIREIEGKSAA